MSHPPSAQVVPRAARLRVGDDVAVGARGGTLLRAPFGVRSDEEEEEEEEEEEAQGAAGEDALPTEAADLDALVADLAALKAAAKTPYATRVLDREATAATAKRKARGGDADDEAKAAAEAKRKAEKLAAMQARLAAFQEGG